VEKAFSEGRVNKQLARVGLEGVSARLQRAPEVEIGQSIQENNQLTATQLCGNGEFNIGETCDDGNTVSADGCSSTCTVEEGFSCGTSSTGSTCQEMCGDLLVVGLEECEDGNFEEGDGCSSSCRVELHWRCTKMSGVYTTAGNGFGKWACLPLPSCGVYGTVTGGYTSHDEKELYVGESLFIICQSGFQVAILTNQPISSIFNRYMYG
jgi:cysteine-rich repeat protein